MNPEPLTLETALHVGLRLRERDNQELRAYFSGTIEEWAAYMMSIEGPGYCFRSRGEPVAFTKYWVLRPGVVRTAMAATDRFREAGICMHMHTTRMHRRLVSLFHRIECVCLDHPESNAAWITRLGYRREERYADIGLHGESVILSALKGTI